MRSNQSIPSLARIVDISYENHELSIDAFVVRTAQFRISCVPFGEPISIIGALKVNYDDRTSILTVETTLLYDSNIRISWES
jgi:hypothetical protein